MTTDERPVTAVRKTDPLHGIKLEQILNELVAEYQWEGLAERISANCFKTNPSVKSSLKFLRRTPWARQKVESLYLQMKGHSAKKRATKTEAVLVAEVKRSIADNAKRSLDTTPDTSPWSKAKRK
ncbi:VF530 family protein [Oceanospirillum maris]|uniref:VF530 family protein n=1 Tax=Oceanospirillum maris TaxID=64977 RepID=UPI00041BA003